MKFEVSSSELLSQLQIASGAINPNPVLPILEDFLFDLNDNNLTITSTNLETTIVSK
jgi:DNA polymerase-3 subunit beta